MNTLMQANIFFFVTTIAVVAFLILGSIAFIYAIGILKNIKKASDKLESELEHLAEHSEEVYQRITESFLFRLIFGKKKPRAKK